MRGLNKAPAKWAYILTFAALLLLGAAARAGVDIQNGVLDTPNAYVMENTQFNVGVSSYVITSRTKQFYTHEGVPFQKNLRELDAFFQFGLFGRLEVGIREYDPETYAGDVKVLIKKESSRWPAIAAGAFNLGGDHDIGPYGAKACWYSDTDRQSNAYYIVASKNVRNIIRVPITVNVGVGAARFQGTNPKWPHSEPWQGMFGSVAYHFLDERISVIGEIDGRDLNIGARFKLPWGLVVTPYVSELEEAWWGGHTTYTLPTPAHPNGFPYEDEYDTPKGGIAVQFYVGPLYRRAETERLRALRSRLKRAEERLKQARQRREILEQRVEEIREELMGP
ncbi:MAG: hypothetical protein GTN49_10975 [candidate division Zixibacteria bacterium]|nr:hypothetical protein [candidate division Zixibacteria bacterium]